MKLSLNKILACVTAVFGLIAVFMLFAPALTGEIIGGEYSYTGLMVTFGSEERALVFSFGNFVPYILLVVGIVFAVLEFLGKSVKFGGIIAAVCFIVAGILFCLPIDLIAFNPEAVPAEAVDTAKEMLRIGYGVGAGYIVAAIFSFIAACTAVAPFVLSLVKKGE